MEIQLYAAYTATAFIKGKPVLSSTRSRIPDWVRRNNVCIYIYLEGFCMALSVCSLQDNTPC